MSLNFIKNIFFDYQTTEISQEQIEIFSEKLLQLWTRSSNISQQGFDIIDYLENLLKNRTMHDTFFIFILSTLAKNQDFYSTFLIEHKRFDFILNSTSRKDVYLIRYLTLSYYYCPVKFIEKQGLEFYRFCLDKYCLKYLQKLTNNIDWLGEFSSLICQFHENMRHTNERIFSTQKDALDYAINVFRTLYFHLLKSQNLNYDMKLISTIVKAIDFVWLDKTVEGQSIEYFFDFISSTEQTMSATILPLFAHVQLDVADVTLRTMYVDHRLSAERFARMIRSLIFLINAPIDLIQSMPYETWVIGLCSALVNFQQHEHLRKIIDECTPFLLEHFVDNQVTLENIYLILFWFIRYDKRSETFRLVLNFLSKYFHKNFNEYFQSKLIELCHIGLTIHPNYDLSNEQDLAEILKQYPQADLNILSNHRQIHERFHSNSNEIELTKKQPTRLGIINLGNTCYVNSVLQALYQCDLFRKYILEHDFSNEFILKELQIVFAQLNLSKRSSVNAINFVKIARPTWFNHNEQQDCAEFLGYLLDTIKEEQKQTCLHIDRLFTIHTCQINRCLSCQIESYREESNNYLFLPIPTNDNQSSNLSINRLKFYPASNRNSTTNVQSQISPSYHLQDVFNCYFQKEQLKDENQYQCEHCRSLQDAERYIILQTAPEYLILSLNRFEYDKTTNIFRKIFTKITYPKRLHVPIYPTRNSQTQSILIHYCLVLVIVHTGYTLHSGHYYVYAREIQSSTNNRTSHDDDFLNDEWFLLNDDFVQLSSYESMIENCAQYTSATPYILFYKRIDQQRIDEMEKNKDIHVHESLIRKIQEENLNCEREQ